MVGLQRLRLAPRAIQGQHQLAAQPLPQRVVCDQIAQLAHELPGATHREIGVHAVFDRGETELLEPRDHRLRERLIGKIRQWRTPPDLQRLAQHRRRLLCVPGRERVATALGQLPEALQIELARRHPK